MPQTTLKAFEICVENSAPSQKLPAKSVVRIVERLNERSIRSAVDYGFGRLRNLKLLESLTDDLTLVDVPAQIERMIEDIPESLRRKTYPPEKFFKLKKKYELITCVAVLHVVPDVKLRTDILKRLRSKLCPNGLLLIDIPRRESYYSDGTKFQSFRDGILLGKGPRKTFRKNYTADEVDTLILSAFPSKHVEVVPGCGGHVRLCSAHPNR